MLGVSPRFIALKCMFFVVFFVFFVGPFIVLFSGVAETLVKSLTLVKEIVGLVLNQSSWIARFL